MIGNIVCIILVMSVIDLHLTSGRYVNDVVIDKHDNLIGELSFKDELHTPAEHAEPEVMKNTSSMFDHLILSRNKRKAIKDPSKRWTNKEIPFEIDYSQFNNNDINLIYQAMQVWQQYTCLRFRHRNAYDRNFVKFMSGDFCYSSDIGMNGGQQEISLPKSGYCVQQDVIIHEIGHAIGFIHEQSRPDRDRFVTVFPENVDKKFNYTLLKYNDDVIDTYGLPYDYTSLMHYFGTAFSKNGRITIQTKDPAFQNIIGHVKNLSYYDIQLANLMYSCSQNCPRIRCPSNGYLGPDCTCWCPGRPVQRC